MPNIDTLGCELCSKEEKVSHIRKQNGHYLCWICHDKHNDDDLEEKIKEKENHA